MSVPRRCRSAGRLALAAVTMVAAAARTAQAGPSYSLGRKAICAQTAVEVELVFARSKANDRLVARAAAGRRAFPSQLREQAVAGARVTATFYEPATEPPELPKPLNLSLPDRVWRAGYERGHLRALLFVRRLKGKPEVLFGVEGVPTDADPDYPQVRAAVEQYARWRANPAAVEAISQAEKLLESTTNVAVATLTSEFLCAAGHLDAVARVARSGAPTRGPCPRPAESCLDW